MPHPTVVGFSGNIFRPSKTFAFVNHVVREIAHTTGLTGSSYDIEDFGSSLPRARRADELDGQARAILERIVGADILVVGTPTYKGSYTGLFKHVFDLVDPAALRGKPVVLTATGGGDRHALIAEHALRPLFGFFEALSLPTAIYATDRDFTDGRIASDAVLLRVAQAVDQAANMLKTSGSFSIAAE
ncbi:MAG: FMN reductase [Rhizobiales bacterium]|nr:FMN reductase [Hyphomicrobiales bacterium]